MPRLSCSSLLWTSPLLPKSFSLLLWFPPKNPAGHSLGLSTRIYSCSVTKSYPTLWPHGLQCTRLPCPSLSDGVCPESCPLSRWCSLTISPSAAPFSFDFFPASGFLPASQLFASGSQNTEVSASVLPASVNIQHQEISLIMPWWSHIPILEMKRRRSSIGVRGGKENKV